MAYWKQETSVEDVHLQVRSLFSNDADLIAGFKQFLPNTAATENDDDVNTVGAAEDETK